jgi:hypothetical protein
MSMTKQRRYIYLRNVRVSTPNTITSVPAFKVHHIDLSQNIQGQKEGLDPAAIHRQTPCAHTNGKPTRITTNLRNVSKL